MSLSRPMMASRMRLDWWLLPSDAATICCHLQSSHLRATQMSFKKKIIKAYVLSKFIFVLASFIANLDLLQPVDHGLNTPPLPSQMPTKLPMRVKINK